MIHIIFKKTDVQAGRHVYVFLLLHLEHFIPESANFEILGIGWQVDVR